MRNSKSSDKDLEASRQPWRWGRAIVLALLAVAGASIAQYPTASNWFLVRDQAAEITGYSETVVSFSGPGKSTLLAQAREYNELVVEGLTAVPGTAPDETYFAQLDPTGRGIIGTLVIPRLNVSMPIYHTSDESSISRGAGHVFGSTLPVGGEGTHTLLSSHSGLPEAELFTHLDEMILGDVFSISVLDQSIYYQVVDTDVVLPDDVSRLRFVPGKDFATLVTCTPTGVNTHRLLVRGERLATVDDETKSVVAGARDSHEGFPWWAVIVPGVGVGTFGLTVIANRSRRHD